MKRRDFFKLSGAGLFGLLPAGPALAQFAEPRPRKYDFFFAQAVYGKNLNWNPRPTVARSLAALISSRTSVPASPERVEIRLDSNDLFSYPFLYLSGQDAFEPFSENEVQKLRRWIDAGGFLLADDALGEPDTGFDQSLRRELLRIFPGEKLNAVPSTHTVFQSYYLVDKVVGRKASVGNLWGIDRGDLTVFMYSQNDLAGAIEQGSGSSFRFTPEPGGEAQRELAARLWVNIIFYALCANYKKDLIHIPFISERRKRRPK